MYHTWYISSAVRCKISVCVVILGSQRTLPGTYIPGIFYVPYHTYDEDSARQRELFSGNEAHIIHTVAPQPTPLYPWPKLFTPSQNYIRVPAVPDGRLDGLKSRQSDFVWGVVRSHDRYIVPVCTSVRRQCEENICNSARNHSTRGQLWCQLWLDFAIQTTRISFVPTTRIIDTRYSILIVNQLKTAVGTFDNKKCYVRLKVDSYVNLNPITG